MWNKTSRTEIIQLDGGLDITNSQLRLKPGAMISCQNFELGPEGGYTSSKGYEPFDGRTRPNVAAFTRLTGVNSDIAVDDTLTQSSATGTVLGVEGNYVYLFVTAGTFAAGAADNGSTGTITITAVDQEAETAALYKSYTKLAADAARALIQAVPGEGPILGVWKYKDVVYAFRDNVGKTAAKMYKSTTSGWSLVTTATLAPGGKYRFCNYNFSGHAGTLKMYGADGKNKAFQFDGTTFTQLTTGMTTDTPKFPTAHHNHLFLFFAGGSVQHSSIKDPTTWSALTGASERSVGDEVTDAVTTPGGLMLIFCRSSIHALYGSSSADWSIKKMSDNYGAIEGTAQNATLPMYLGDSGLSIISTTEKFGDFDDQTVSYPVMKIVKNYRSLATCSTTVRSKNQYRVFFSNGECLVMTFIGTEIRGFTTLSYPIPVRCVSSSLRSDSGTDDIFFGSDDGFIYQMDVGRSFAGEAKTEFFRLPFFHGGSSRNKKVFRSIELEVITESGEPVSIYFKPDFSLFDTNTPEGISKDIETEITGANWNEADWNEFYWNAGSADEYYYADVSGVGCGMGLTIGAFSDSNEQYTIKSIIVRYGMRGEKR